MLTGGRQINDRFGHCGWQTRLVALAQRLCHACDAQQRPARPTLRRVRSARSCCRRRMPTTQCSRWREICRGVTPPSRVVGKRRHRGASRCRSAAPPHPAIRPAPGARCRRRRWRQAADGSECTQAKGRGRKTGSVSCGQLRYNRQMLEAVSPPGPPQSKQHQRTARHRNGCLQRRF